MSGMNVMRGETTNSVIRHIRRAVLPVHGADLNDAELLESYIRQRDEVAFEVLVRRHGPMVLGVCQRVLRDAADAEDAFQATFLVLVRKAATVVPRRLVGHWLYGVAYRTAMKAKCMRHRRKARESQAVRPAGADRNLDWEAMLPVLDQELTALPEKYQLPIVLCDLQGKTHREAALLLGCPTGTVSTRVVTGRRLLARRLARRGVTLPAGAVAAHAAAQAQAGVLPPALLAAVVRSGSLLAAGSLISQVVPSNVVNLTEGVLKTMLLQKLRQVLAMILMATIVWAVSMILISSAAQKSAPGSQQTPPPSEVPQSEAGQRKVLQDQTWYARVVDSTKGTISLVDRPRGPFGHGLHFTGDLPGIVGPSGLRLDDLKVDKNCDITLDGKPATLKDLEMATNLPPDLGVEVKAGVRLLIRWADGRLTLAKIEAFSTKANDEQRYFLSAVHPVKKTLSVRIGKVNSATLANLRVAEDADIELYYYAKPPDLKVPLAQTHRKATLQDLRVDMSLHLEISPDAMDKQLVVRVLKAGDITVGQANAGK